MDNIIRKVMMVLLCTACALFTYYMFFGVSLGTVNYKGIIPACFEGMEITTSEYYRVFCYDVNHAEHKMFDDEAGSWVK